MNSIAHKYTISAMRVIGLRRFDGAHAMADEPDILSLERYACHKPTGAFGVAAF